MCVLKGSKPTIIGLHGVSGPGRSYLSNKLRTDTTLKALAFVFHDGSNLLDQITPGGLVKFKQLDSASKLQYREAALAKVSQDCQDHGQTAFIAGQYLLWNAETEPRGLVVGIEKDWQTYTHIIYLNTDPAVILHQIKTDTHRKQPITSVEDLHEWEDQERNVLREICRERGILFTTLSSCTSSLANVTTLKFKTLLKDFANHAKESNLLAVDNALTAALGHQDQLEKVLLFDADKTLAPKTQAACSRNTCLAILILLQTPSPRCSAVRVTHTIPSARLHHSTKRRVTPSSSSAKKSRKMWIRTQKCSLSSRA
jgi:hypothetical protein